MDAASVIAILTGFAGLVAASGGVLLAIRAVRSRERKAAKAEIDELSHMLGQERERRVAVELVVYQCRVIMAQHGLTPPPLPDEPEIEPMPERPQLRGLIRGRRGHDDDAD